MKSSVFCDPAGIHSKILKDRGESQERVQSLLFGFELKDSGRFPLPGETKLLVHWGPGGSLFPFLEAQSGLGTFPDPAYLTKMQKDHSTAPNRKIETGRQGGAGHQPPRHFRLPYSSGPQLADSLGAGPRASPVQSWKQACLYKGSHSAICSEMTGTGERGSRASQQSRAALCSRLFCCNV